MDIAELPSYYKPYDNINFQDLQGQSQTENLDIDSIINEIGE